MRTVVTNSKRVEKHKVGSRSAASWFCNMYVGCTSSGCAGACHMGKQSWWAGRTVLGTAPLPCMPACAAAVHMHGPFCTAIALLTAPYPIAWLPHFAPQLTAKSKPWTLLEKGRCPRGALAFVRALVLVPTALLAGQKAWPGCLHTTAD